MLAPRPLHMTPAERLRRVHQRSAPVLREVAGRNLLTALGIGAMLISAVAFGIYVAAVASQLVAAYVQRILEQVMGG